MVLSSVESIGVFPPRKRRCHNLKDVANALVYGRLQL